MKLADLVKSNQWLSVEMTLLSLYPDQKEMIDDYRSVFESLQLMDTVPDDMLIVITEYVPDISEENNSTSAYVDVSGRKRKPDTDSITSSYALEFVKWETWLGMDLAPETIENFDELQIIAHCLHEMTFCGYEQEEIQEQFRSITEMAEEARNLRAEEGMELSVSLDDLKKKLDKNGSNQNGLIDGL